MTLLSVVRDVCEVVGVQAPQSVFSGITANRTMQEMLALANEMAQRIAYDTRDWTYLRKVKTIPGDGLTHAFDLPADFKRLLLTANVWRSPNKQSPMQFVPDYDEWLNRRSRNTAHINGEWTMAGGQLLIEPVLELNESAYYPYMHKNCIRLASSGLGDAFLNDGDSYALDERVLKLGMIWQWKAWKGSPYAEDVGSYGDALTNAMGHDSPAPTIIGRKVISANARLAYPWQVPT